MPYKVQRGGRSVEAKRMPAVASGADRRAARRVSQQRHRARLHPPGDVHQGHLQVLLRLGVRGGVGERHLARRQGGALVGLGHGRD